MWEFGIGMGRNGPNNPFRGSICVTFMEWDWMRFGWLAIMVTFGTGTVRNGRINMLLVALII